METEQKFLLRLTDKAIYPKLKRIAKEKRWSLNSLINSVLEETVKNNKKKLEKVA